MTNAKKSLSTKSTTNEEMNLVEFPIGLISDRPPKDPETGKEVKTFEWEKWISLPDGERVKQQWIITGSDKYGLPRGFDFCVLFLMIQIWSEQGFNLFGSYSPPLAASLARVSEPGVFSPCGSGLPPLR